MDLALTMGRTASDLRRDMSEVELFDWGRYAAQKGLPWARVEKLLEITSVRLAVGAQVEARVRQACTCIKGHGRRGYPAGCRSLGDVAWTPDS